MENKLVTTDGVVEKVKLDPDVAETKVDSDEVELRVKSPDTAVVVPLTPVIPMVQVTVVPILAGFVFKHTRLDALVAVPKTT